MHQSLIVVLASPDGGHRECGKVSTYELYIHISYIQFSESREGEERPRADVVGSSVTLQPPAQTTFELRSAALIFSVFAQLAAPSARCLHCCRCLHRRALPNCLAVMPCVLPLVPCDVHRDHLRRIVALLVVSLCPRRKSVLPSDSYEKNMH